MATNAGSSLISEMMGTWGQMGTRNLTSGLLSLQMSKMTTQGLTSQMVSWGLDYLRIPWCDCPDGTIGLDFLGGNLWPDFSDGSLGLIS